MNIEQKNALRCAIADLQGALEAYRAGDMHQHDWKAHELSIIEMLEAFPDLDMNETSEMDRLRELNWASNNECLNLNTTSDIWDMQDDQQ